MQIQIRTAGKPPVHSRVIALSDTPHEFNTKGCTVDWSLTNQPRLYT